MSVGRRISAPRAAEILQRLFGHRSLGVAFRLWDGTPVTFGGRAPVCTAVIHRQETFIRLVRDPSPFNFAEAYVDGAIDLEGDLFAAMDVANAVEELKVPLSVRLRVLGTMWAA